MRVLVNKITQVQTAIIFDLESILSEIIGIKRGNLLIYNTI